MKKIDWGTRSLKGKSHLLIHKAFIKGLLQSVHYSSYQPYVSGTAPNARGKRARFRKLWKHMACNAVYSCHCSSIVRAQEGGLDSGLGFTKRKAYLELSQLGLENESIFARDMEQKQGNMEEENEALLPQGPQHPNEQLILSEQYLKQKHTQVFPSHYYPSSEFKFEVLAQQGFFFLNTMEKKKKKRYSMTTS